jgi:uncharacterized RDD family membrane protein YckC
MSNEIQQDILDPSEFLISYGTFWPRFAAILIDGLITVPVTLVLNIYNVTIWKSPILLICVVLIQVGYKIFFEAKYGATIGKMALGLKVVNHQLTKASLNQIFLRNIVQVVAGLVTLFSGLYIFGRPEFQSITTFREYSVLSTRSGGTQFFNLSIGVFYIVDAIFLMTDKESQSLHDRIGKTYVIKKN